MGVRTDRFSLPTGIGSHGSGVWNDFLHSHVSGTVRVWARTTKHNVLIPKIVTCERPIALLLMSILRALFGARVEVKKENFVGRCRRPQMRSRRNCVENWVLLFWLSSNSC